MVAVYSMLSMHQVERFFFTLYMLFSLSLSLCVRFVILSVVHSCRVVFVLFFCCLMKFSASKLVCFPTGAAHRFAESEVTIHYRSPIRNLQGGQQQVSLLLD